MPDDSGGSVLVPRVFIGIFAVVWALVVVILVMGLPPDQRLLSAGPLAVVGAVIGALGYMSMVKRRAVRDRQKAMERMLEQRRRERV
jgi:hypothetical protein